MQRLFQLIQDSEEEVSFKLTREAKRVKLDQKQSNGKPSPPPPAQPRKSPNGFILPDPLPDGHLVMDNRGRQWRIGKSIGLGGFGEIYAAARKGYTDQDYVVKVRRQLDMSIYRALFAPAI